MTKPNLPEILAEGNPSTIFPVVSDISYEARLVSIFLSVLIRVDPLAKAMFKTCNFNVWKQAKWQAFTEVVPACDSSSKIDGFVSASKGQSQWYALIEAKVKANVQKNNQISKYMKAAKDSKINAMITISNQLVSRPAHPVVNVSKTLTRDVTLVHWSWTYIETQCRIVLHQNADLTSDQKFILSEFIEMISNPKVGSSRYDSMPPEWKSIVNGINSRKKFKWNDSDVSATANGWIQKQQDIALKLSRNVGVHVKVALTREHKRNHDLLHQYVSKGIVEDHHSMEASFNIPEAANELRLVVDIARKSVSASMTLRTPPKNEMKTAKRCVTWISGMIKSDDGRILVESKFGSKNLTQVSLEDLRKDWSYILYEGAPKDSRPGSIKVMISEDLGAQFVGKKKFPERVENIVIDFYKIVGQHLKQYKVSPPKPIRDAFDGRANDAVEETAARKNIDDDDKTEMSKSTSSVWPMFTRK